MPGSDWDYPVIRAPISDLISRYPAIGDGDGPGLLPGLGLTAEDLTGRRIADLAESFRDRVATGAADFANPTIQRILKMVMAGPDALLGAEQMILLLPHQAAVYVREGSHRSIALAILGENSIEGVDLTRMKPAHRESV